LQKIILRHSVALLGWARVWRSQKNYPFYPLSPTYLAKWCPLVPNNILLWKGQGVPPEKPQTLPDFWKEGNNAKEQEPSPKEVGNNHNYGL